MRIGTGYDAHRLVEGRLLVLGGVEIAYGKGLLGHSDADVLTHAVIDALLGAAALGDIGRMFPDTDDQYKDINSLLLLKEAGSALRARGYSVINIDSTIIAQKPRLSPYVGEMAKNIAASLGIAPECVNVKAKTEEGMGFTGSGEGIAAQAVVLIDGGI